MAFSAAPAAPLHGHRNHSIQIAAVGERSDSHKLASPRKTLNNVEVFREERAAEYLRESRTAPLAVPRSSRLEFRSCCTEHFTAMRTKP